MHLDHLGPLIQRQEIFLRPAVTSTVRLSPGPGALGGSKCSGNNLMWRGWHYSRYLQLINFVLERRFASLYSTIFPHLQVGLPMPRARLCKRRGLHGAYMVFAVSLNIFEKASLVFVNQDQSADWLLLEPNNP